jgi:ribonuclease inhibitor
VKTIISFLLISIFSISAFASGVVTIDGKKIKSREILHKEFSKGLNLPNYYGKNLDALYEVLVSDYSGESVIKFKNLNILKQRIGSEYLQDLLALIGEASESNPRIILILE